MIKRLIAYGVLFPLLISIGISADTIRKAEVSSAPKVKKNSIPNYDGFIIEYKKNINISQSLNKLSRNINVISSRKLKNSQNIVHLKSKISLEKLKAELSKDPNIISFQPNYRRRLYSITPDDTGFRYLWGLNNTGQYVNAAGSTEDSDIDAPEAWEKNKGSGDIVVAVFDTGVDYNHNDLGGFASNIWVNQAERDGVDGEDDDGNGYIDDVYGYDFASDNSGGNDSDPIDVHGHGTHVSGTIGAKGDNGRGIVGVNWNVKIMALKVVRPNGDIYVSDTIEAIKYVETMKRRGVNIVAINASYGQGGGSQSDTMNTLIKGLNILFCAAGGNGGDDQIGDDNDRMPQYPASYNANNIIAVAATDPNDALASFSNYGSASVDIAAPGVHIMSTVPQDTYDYKDGTSMAVPHVTGTVALMTSEYPKETALQRKARILSGVDKITTLNGKILTGGRLNLYKSIIKTSIVDNDFNGDGIADILWRHAGGQYLIFYMNADGSRSSYKYGFTVPNTWSIADTNDFNGDGIEDIIWRHTSGQYLVYYMLPNGSRGRYAYGPIVGTYYMLEDTNDFNGDGIADIIWRNKLTGQYRIDYMLPNGTRGRYKAGSTVGLHYRLADTNDFNGDGIADILWRNIKTGQYRIDYMLPNGTRGRYMAGSVVSLHFAFEDTNDFNGDGIADILWRNKDNGQYLIFFMNANGSRKGLKYGMKLSNIWQIADTNDFNGDGVADILWRHTGGQYLTFFMNADGSRKEYKYGSFVPSSWEVQPNPYVEGLSSQSASCETLKADK